MRDEKGREEVIIFPALAVIGVVVVVVSCYWALCFFIYLPGKEFTVMI